MSVLVWAMVGIALWHFAVLVPDRFWGGIIGAFMAALLGALVSGFALPVPGLRTVLDAAPDLRVVAEASDGLEAVEIGLRADIHLAILEWRCRCAPGCRPPASSRGAGPSCGSSCCRCTTSRTTASRR